MSQTSIHLDRDCHLECRCPCRSQPPRHVITRPLLLAVCPVQVHSTDLVYGCVLAVYDSGYVILADSREECENLSTRDVEKSGIDLLRFTIRRTASPLDTNLEVVNGKDAVLAELQLSDRLTREIVYMAVQRALTCARSQRSPNVVYSATVYEGTVLLQRQYIAVTADRMFVQGPNISVVNHPSKHAKVYTALDRLEFQHYGNDGRGMTIYDDKGPKKRTAVNCWFATPEDRQDFFTVVNSRQNQPTRHGGLDETAQPSVLKNVILLGDVTRQKINSANLQPIAKSLRTVVKVSSKPTSLSETIKESIV